jgi:hypothetical protein
MFPAPSRRGQYLFCAAFGATTLAAFRLLNPAAAPDLPVRNLQMRTGGVLLAGLLASIPWLTIVWLAHAECHDLERELPRRTSGHLANDYAAAQVAG